ncbi:MAG TPA: HAMP domain-containing sensor histidine kinase [Acidimicrobiales bacterium]|nr:HAMP domain-containing sensor histidine kinase [Acidimicrobiales bacterium]
MVDLLEAQAHEIKSLQRAVRDLEGRLDVLCQLDAMVASQLRDPLDAIEYTLDALFAQGQHPEWQHAVEQALAQVRSLAAVVSELDAPQKIGPAPVERSRLVTVPLDGLVEQALTVASQTVDRERVEVDLPAGFMITTAPRRLVGILVTLFENAANCAPTGVIECRGEMEDGWLKIEVADRGPALADVDLESLFEPQSEEDSCARSRSTGMYMVRMLARSLGGAATVANRPGGGAVSSVQLPQRRDGDVRSVTAHQ